jgi:surface antigen
MSDCFGGYGTGRGTAVWGKARSRACLFTTEVSQMNIVVTCNSITASLRAMSTQRTLKTTQPYARVGAVC